jgi:hypothetical protein
MNKTQNTLISTPGYPGRLPFCDSFSSELAVRTWPAGDLGDISQIWMTPSVEVDTFLQGTPIPGSNLELKYALVVEKRITHDGVVIRSGALDEEAFGLTETEAYFDFLTSLRDRYDSLKGRGPSLSAHDSSVLEKLRNLLSPTQS